MGSGTPAADRLSAFPTSAYYSVPKFSAGNRLEKYLSCFVVSGYVGFFKIDLFRLFRFASAGHVHASSDLAT